MRDIPPIKSVMTPFPYSIAGERSPREARAMMAEHEIQHLPVVDDGTIIGVLRERDLDLALDERIDGADRLRAREVCRGETYVVEMTTPLDRVLARMAERHHDSALVVKEGRLVGIFTATDACQRFSELLRTLFPHGRGDDVA